MLRRNDGAPAYNLAVVVDDADQGIDEVVRGDDLLDSTPRQVLLGRLLGPARARATPTCRWCSAPTAPRLAKRHGAVTLPERDEPVEATVRWMAVGLGQEPLTAAELVERFDPERIPREPTVFDGGRTPNVRELLGDMAPQTSHFVGRTPGGRDLRRAAVARLASAAIRFGRRGDAGCIPFIAVSIAVGIRRVTPRGMCWAAVLASGEGAAFSHRSAAAF